MVSFKEDIEREVEGADGEGKHHSRVEHELVRDRSILRMEEPVPHGDKERC